MTITYAAATPADTITALATVRAAGPDTATQLRRVPPGVELPVVPPPNDDPEVPLLPPV